MLNTRIGKEGSGFSERRLIDSGNSDYDPLGFLAVALHLILIEASNPDRLAVDVKAAVLLCTLSIISLKTFFKFDEMCQHNSPAAFVHVMDRCCKKKGYNKLPPASFISILVYAQVHPKHQVPWGRSIVFLRKWSPKAWISRLLPQGKTQFHLLPHDLCWWEYYLEVTRSLKMANKCFCGCPHSESEKDIIFCSRRVNSKSSHM